MALLDFLRREKKYHEVIKEDPKLEEIDLRLTAAEKHAEYIETQLALLERLRNVPPEHSGA